MQVTYKVPTYLLFSYISPRCYMKNELVMSDQSLAYSEIFLLFCVQPNKEIVILVYLRSIIATSKARDRCPGYRIHTCLF